MPIYAYKCASCGFAKDVLQKMSDDPLTQCPSCGKASFQKQVTAASFRLKGTGWYVTDFRDEGKPAAKPDSPASAEPAGPAQGAATQDASTPAKAAPAAQPAAAASAAQPAATKPSTPATK